jgi:ABC-type dipeptide/oligopeptide/nickel transport system permease subunit
VTARELDAARASIEPRGGRALWARLRANRAARVGGAIVAALVVFVVAGPILAPHDAYTSDFVNGASRLRTPIGPSRTFWLGADRVYRDEFARVAVGGRLSLVIGVVATAIATVVGALVGIVAGWFEGTDGVSVPWGVLLAALLAVVAGLGGHAGLAAFCAIACVTGVAGAIALPAEAPALKLLRKGPRVNVDVILMRTVDVGLAFPFLLLVMAVGAALERTTPATVIVVLGLTGWLGTARVVRTKTMQVRALDFVMAARALGRPTAGVLWHHVLPNVSGLVIAVATVSVAQMILAESILGYLGVGIAPPQPTWGRMVMEGQDLLMAVPWLVLAPAGAIVLAVVGFHLLGEGLRDALDPRA